MGYLIRKVPQFCLCDFWTSTVKYNIFKMPILPLWMARGNIYSANFDTFQVYLPDVRPEPAYEHCATIWPLYIMCSKYVPAFLWKLYMKIFNTLSILHLVLFYLQLNIYCFVLYRYLYCIVLYCIVLNFILLYCKVWYGMG